MFLSVIVVARDGNWTPTNGDIYGTFLACVLCHGVLASSMSKIMGKLQTVFVIMNFILIFATIIALPIGTKNRNSGHYIFAQIENLTTWPTGWAFMLSWLSPIWTIGAFDSCVHMSEEASNATKAVVRLHSNTFSLFIQAFFLSSKLILYRIAFRYPHVNRLMLVLRFHPRNCHSRLHQPRSKLSFGITVGPANGSGKWASKALTF
jgi:hypothetical protein